MLAAMSLHVRLLVIVLAAALCANARADTFVGRESSADVRARVLELVNDARSQSRRCGRESFPAAAPLLPSQLLTRAARNHAVAMARANFFDHSAPDGSQPKDRIARLGYQSRLTGENIALGPESAEEVVRGWLASPGHCANIMDARFEEIGIAYALEDRRRRIYWVQVFARPPSSPATSSAASESHGDYRPTHARAEKSAGG
jgi:uncharacterized protein YkwD